MQQINFKHKVSRGSKFNQIYIPEEMRYNFEVGDLVEVRLLRKKEKLYYSNNLKKTGNLPEFKENLIKQIFSILEKFKEIKQAFIVGSFLIENIKYNDIDIILISDKKEIEEKFCNYLSEKIQMNFHVIAIPEKKLNELSKICPLTRSMLYYFVSNKDFSVDKKIEINKKHIDFLLMMPNDLIDLEISNGRIYFDGLRRLITIKRFLEKKELNPILINEELKKVLEKNYLYLKNNENIDNEILIIVKKEIKKELSKINNILKRI